MASPERPIDSSYEQFYAARRGTKVYPTEFVVRTFLASYPGLTFDRPRPGQRVLDVAFGDGRNTTFLCDQGFEVAGIEITQGIVDQTQARLDALDQHADLRVGRNSCIPWDGGWFDCILACHCCYYCDDGETFAHNMAEYARVLRPGGVLIASVANAASYIFREAQALDDGSLRVAGDPYNNRNGYRLQAFATREQVQQALAPWFHRFSFGAADNDYYGITERVFWVACHKQ